MQLHLPHFLAAFFTKLMMRKPEKTWAEMTQDERKKSIDKMNKESGKSSMRGRVKF